MNVFVKFFVSWVLFFSCLSLVFIQVGRYLSYDNDAITGKLFPEPKYIGRFDCGKVFKYESNLEKNVEILDVKLYVYGENYTKVYLPVSVLRFYWSYDNSDEWIPISTSADFYITSPEDVGFYFGIVVFYGRFYIEYIETFQFISDKMIIWTNTTWSK